MLFDKFKRGRSGQRYRKEMNQFWDSYLCLLSRHLEETPWCLLTAGKLQEVSCFVSCCSREQDSGPCVLDDYSRRSGRDKGYSTVIAVTLPIIRINVTDLPS